ncbi:DNA/RNA helicase domain-containing protein [Bacillus subtilis]|uniref:DNA/RNA helicase domain-containing protein n=1 Tax=Bacillus subtilis TaxID=1423 RepID=UPI001F3A4BD0|nr:DNA/RNA helicase domain-containing protein [Bacillus subtilis]
MAKTRQSLIGMKGISNGDGKIGFFQRMEMPKIRLALSSPVQGIDLNKVGVLIGNDLQVDAKGRLFGDPENYHNVNGKFSKDDVSPKNAQEFNLFVLNICYILMTRGIDGIRLGSGRMKHLKSI